jgi:HlyD family secretion protein
MRAPRDGRVEALPYKLGERPPTGAPVVVMLADGLPYARIYVPEPLRARVTAGTAVNVSVDGIEGALRGIVRYVSAEAAYTPYYALTQKDRARLSFLAEVTLDDPRAASLPVGLPVQVTLPATP